MSWREALFARRTMGVRLGLDAVSQVDAELGRPAHGVAVAHLVGTNGKGSTAAMLAHGLRRAGKGRVGLFTSPHLVRIGERMRVDGVAATDHEVEQLVERVLAAERSVGEALSFFEVITLAALLHFAACEVGVIVLEAGLGGRLDTTRLRRSEVTLVSRIGLDHQAFLGDTLTAIAAEKAAVLHADAPVFTVAQRHDVATVLYGSAARVNTSLTTVLASSRVPSGLVGAFQAGNAALALAGLQHFAPRADLTWIDGVTWPGRWDRRRIGAADVVLDVGHNEDAVSALEPELERFDPDLVVFGCMEDKPAEVIARRLRRFGRRHWLVDIGSRGVQSLPGWETIGSLSDSQTRARVSAACATSQRVFVGGSHQLVGAWLGGPDGVDPNDPRHVARPQ